MFIQKYLKKISNLLKYLFVTLPFEHRELAFIRHNKKVWKSSLPAGAAGEILVEVHPVASTILAQSYLANVLAEKHQASIVGYNTRSRKFMMQIYNFRFHRIYRSFGAKRFFYADFSRSQLDSAAKMADQIIRNLKTKKDVEDLEVEGVIIGDLLYDSHLMNNKVPTIDLEDPKFLESLRDALSYFYFWKDYLDQNPVKAVIVTHCCYHQNGVVVRLCIKRGIPCYQVNATHCHSMDQNHDRAYLEYKYFPKLFQDLSKAEQEAGLALAKNRLDMRFSGVVGVDMHYSTKSAYANRLSQRVLADSPKKKILVAPHCFFDSPHPYGNNLFPDYYEWFDFLGKMSGRTDYEWYVKTHPDVLPGNIPVIKGFIEKYPKLTLLPSAVSHNQLIEEGISVVLTVEGTIGNEYAARGIPVINASLTNPHAAYDFNLHIGDRAEYERILLNLDKLKMDINKSQAYEYYYMKHLDKSDCWLYDDYSEFLKSIGGYNQQLNSIAYDYFMEKFSTEKHDSVKSILSGFVDSKEYYMSRKFSRTAGRLS